MTERIISGGKYWAVEEQVLISGEELCYCRKGVVTCAIPTFGTTLLGEPEMMGVCRNCYEAEKQSYVEA